MYNIPRYTVSLVREGTARTSVKIIRQPVDAYEIVRHDLDFAVVEHFKVLLLDVKNKVIGISLVSMGALNMTIIHPRDVFQRALLSNAAGIIAVHNHPSGDPTPSQEDITFTKKLAEAGKVMGIPLLDHVIIGEDCYRSLKEEGIL